MRRLLVALLTTFFIVGAAPAAADASGPAIGRRAARVASCKPTDKKKPGHSAAKPPKGGKEPTAPEPEPEASPAASSAPTPKGASGPADEEGKTLQRGERVEFDARLIQGQSAKAGAVYLFARVATNLKSMVKERTSFRDKVVRTVYPTEEAKP